MIVLLEGDGVIAAPQQNDLEFNVEGQNVYQSREVMRSFATLTTLGCEFRYIFSEDESEKPQAWSMGVGIPRWPTELYGESPLEVVERLLEEGKAVVWVSASTLDEEIESNRFHFIGTRGEGINSLHIAQLGHWALRYR